MLGSGPVSFPFCLLFHFLALLLLNMLTNLRLCVKLEEKDIKKQLSYKTLSSWQANVVRSYESNYGQKASGTKRL